MFANWRDLKAIYGFWRGEIGGPSIQRLAFTDEDVAGLLRKHDRIGYSIYKTDIADLERSERDPNFGARSVIECKVSSCLTGTGATSLSGPPTTKINPAIARLFRERAEKFDRAHRKGVRLETVIFGNGDYAPDAPVREVK